MELKTNRLYIREISSNDWTDLKNIVTDFENSEYAIYDSPFPAEEQVFKELVKRFSDSHLFFVVFLQGMPEMIGYVCFHNNGGQFDLGYCFHSDYQGKGYAFESCLSVMQYMKRYCGAEGFTAGTALLNTPSCKLLEKLGFDCVDTEQLSFHKDESGNDIIFQGGNFVYKRKID